MSVSKMINITMPIFFMLFSIWIIVTANAMGAEEKSFPLMIGCFQLIVSFFQLYSDFRGNNSSAFSNSNAGKVLEATIVMALYVFLLKKIGYIADTFLLAAYIPITLGYRSRKIVLLSALAITISTFIIFKLFLKVPLPMKLLEF